MTTAEKRVQLEAQGVPWPVCDCHNVPMLWQRNMALTDGGVFHCRVEHNNWRRQHRQNRRQAGKCTYCDRPLETGARCRDCADAHADFMASPGQQLKHSFAVARHRQRVRADEGFRPTGAGLAAFAAWTERTER